MIALIKLDNFEIIFNETIRDAKLLIHIYDKRININVVDIFQFQCKFMCQMKRTTWMPLYRFDLSVHLLSGALLFHRFGQYSGYCCCHFSCKRSTKTTTKLWLYRMCGIQSFTFCGNITRRKKWEMLSFSFLLWFPMSSINESPFQSGVVLSWNWKMNSTSTKNTVY